MSWTTEQYVAVAAVVVLSLSVVGVWQVADVRTSQAATAKQADLVDAQVATRQTAGDYDGDGIPDASDRCPTRPETTNGFQDDDGCPDVVATTGAS